MYMRRRSRSRVARHLAGYGYAVGKLPPLSRVASFIRIDFIVFCFAAMDGFHV